jgi:glycosyltransferase involved in cell wall biosynthesis/peptidoglycan/xylan/chitin deacetylase (PgdA/CDA1 family)
MIVPVKLSIVIPTHNRGDVLLPRTLPAIFEQDFPADEYEAIVVVDGSTDSTAEALRRLQPPCTLRVIEQPKRGPSAARNKGIRAANGDLLLFLDDDVICGPRLLQRHVAAHTAPGPAVVYGRIFVASGTPASVYKCAVESWYQKYYGLLDSQNGLKWPGDDYLISNSSVPRAALLACGGFDEDMPAKEDYELGLRLWKAGVRFQYLPQAVAYEFYVKPSGYVLSHDGEIYGRAEVLLSRKHSEYRSCSQLAALGRMVWWKRQWRRINVRLPVSFASLLSPPLWACDRLSRFSIMQRVGHRLLGMGRGITEFRSATREVGSWNALENEFGTRLPVLVYHHVGPLKPGCVPAQTVSPRRFECQVRWLARHGYSGICPSDWLRWRREGKGLPHKPVLLTFDDGYADLAEFAFPVLRRYGFKAEVFVVTGRLGGTNTWDEAGGYDTLRLLTAEQIRFWANQGIEFGSHGRTHADLTTLSPQELAAEVVGSRDDLAALLRAPVESFSYPYGHHNPAVVECVRGAFDLAFLVDRNKIGLNHLLTDPHLLLRNTVRPDDSWRALWCRTRLGYDPFLNLRTRLGLGTHVKWAAGLVSGGRKR